MDSVQVIPEERTHVGGDITIRWEMNTVAAHLGHDVLPKDHYFLCAVDQPAGVGGKAGRGDSLAQGFCGILKEWRPGGGWRGLKYVLFYD